jgi:hypothetical protein
MMVAETMTDDPRPADTTKVVQHIKRLTISQFVSSNSELRLRYINIALRISVQCGFDNSGAGDQPGHESFLDIMNQLPKLLSDGTVEERGKRVHAFPSKARRVLAGALSDVAIGTNADEVFIADQATAMDLLPIVISELTLTAADIANYFFVLKSFVSRINRDESHHEKHLKFVGNVMEILKQCLEPKKFARKGQPG